MLLSEKDTVAVKLRFASFLAMLLVGGLGFSRAALAQEPEQGIEISILRSSFVGGDSGPTVLGGNVGSESRYDDTFSAGVGLTAQYFRQIRSVFRWQVGIVHQSWPGKFFEGGEFQEGWAFGAGGQFDDLTLTGVYGGLSAIRGPDARFRPFASIDLAIVSLSNVNVVVSGTSQPYWTSTTKDYLQMRGGVAYEISPRASLTIHAGFSVLGQPESVSIFSSGTAASALNFGVGISYVL